MCSCEFFRYRLGVRPPPHVSPFADSKSTDEYVPEQQRVLEQWALEAQGGSKGEGSENEAEGSDSESEGDEEDAQARAEAAEEAYNRELASELKGKSKEGSDDEAEGSESEDEEEEEEEKEDEEEMKRVRNKVRKKQAKLEQQKEMAAMLMTSKTARLHTRVKGFADKKAATKAKLTKRKAEADVAAAEPVTKKAKRSKKSKKN